MPRFFDAGCGDPFVCHGEWECRYGGTPYDSAELAACIATADDFSACLTPDCAAITDIAAQYDCWRAQATCIAGLCNRALTACQLSVAISFLDCQQTRDEGEAACNALADATDCISGCADTETTCNSGCTDTETTCIDGCAGDPVCEAACIATATACMTACGTAYSECSILCTLNAAQAAGECQVALGCNTCSTNDGFAACAETEARRTAADTGIDARRKPLCSASIIACRTACQDDYATAYCTASAAYTSCVVSCSADRIACYESAFGGSGDTGTCDADYDACVADCADTQNTANVAATNAMMGCYEICCKTWQKTKLDGGNDYDDAALLCYDAHRTCLADGTPDCDATLAGCLAGITSPKGCVECANVLSDPADALINFFTSLMPSVGSWFTPSD